MCLCVCACAHMCVCSMIFFPVISVHIDIARVFNNVLPQQTQNLDATGEKTITANYTNWYVVAVVCYPLQHVGWNRPLLPTSTCRVEQTVVTDFSM